MMKHLLVPLDGSELAEEALLIAGNLAEALDAEITLVRIVPPPVPGRFYAPNLLEQMQEAQAKEAEAYLASVAKRLADDRLSKVSTHVLTGEAATTIIRFVNQHACDLIVMGSHGLGGVGWHVFGSVAQKVLHSSACPVLIVRPKGEEWEREEELEEQDTDRTLLSELRGGSRES
ncbi:MAG: universal stress protein [Dehalococcoidia bacterium]